MGVYIQVSGGDPVYATVERIFEHVAEVRQYLERWGISQPDDAFITAPARPDRCEAFKHRSHSFLISHTLEDIFSKDALADNEVVKTKRASRPTYERGRGGDEALKHWLPPEMHGDVDSQPKAAPQGARNGTRGASSSSRHDAPSGNTVSLADLCTKLKLDPRKARQALRKAFGAGGKRYEWPVGSDELKKVEGVLSK